MRRFLVITAVLSLTVTAVAADHPMVIQARLGIVHYNEADVNTYYYYVATIPAFVFHYNNNCYESPLLTDGGGNTAGYFHEDFAAYLSQVGGLKQLWAVGDVPDATVNSLLSTYNLGSSNVVRIPASTPANVAQAIASDWSKSDNAVLVPAPANPSEHEYKSAANGAALAAMLNAPLLYVNQNGVPGDTLMALSRLGVKNVYLVEFNDYCGPGVNSQLTGAGYTIAKDYTTVTPFVQDMRSRAGHSALMTYRDNWQSMAAALGAARHGGFAVPLDAAVATEVRKVSDLLATLEMPTEKVHLGEWALPDEYRSGEQAIADAFIAFLDNIGGTDAGAVEWVTYFGPKSGGDNENVNFDRAIIGDPSKPTQAGCNVGRFPGDVPQNVLYANRAYIYRAIVFGNPFPARALMAFNAFSCHYYEQGYKFYDNNNQGRCVNEIYGVPQYNEVGVADTFWDKGYTAIFDAGSTSGTYQGNNYHPINPSWHTLQGYLRYLDEGTTFYYYSGHGSQGSISSMVSDGGVGEHIPWGTQYWPSTAGLITNAWGNVALSTWDSTLHNIHSTIITFDACLCGAGNWNEVGMAHGGAGAISSYVSVSWEGSGWCWCLTADEMTTAGKTVSASLGYALANTSHIYPAHLNGKDGTLMYYWVGDPFMEYYKPAWTVPQPAPLGNDYGGHEPGDLLPVTLAYAGATRTGDAVKLSWATVGPTAAGFNVYRAAGADAAAIGAGRVRVNDSLIKGRSPYTFVDERAPAGNVRYWLEEVVPNGRSAVFGPIVADAAALPAAFALRQNYPNPARTVTTITFSLPSAGKASLTVYDCAGRRVATPLDGYVKGGDTVIEYDTSTLPPGVYTYRLVAGDSSAVKRMVVVR